MSFQKLTATVFSTRVLTTRVLTTRVLTTATALLALVAIRPANAQQPPSPSRSFPDRTATVRGSAAAEGDLSDPQQIWAAYVRVVAENAALRARLEMHARLSRLERENWELKAQLAKRRRLSWPPKARNAHVDKPSKAPVSRPNSPIFEAKDLRDIMKLWERIWNLDQPEHMKPQRVHGGVI